MVVRLLLTLTIMRLRLLPCVLSGACVALSCSQPPPIAPADAGQPPLEASARRGQFSADPVNQPGDEAYLCYAIDIDGISDVHVGRVTWHPPAGPVILHHASLFAAAGL